ncbi:amidase family protein [Streptomyces sp. NPDC004111]|uniref:amidase family protein n=1 Tax=Streptomyces sp. NPDC004111 TaxID=3364690 RepID=UPI003678E628
MQTVDAALDRIAALDPVLCAFLEVWEEQARSARPDPELPLAGLPFAVKGRAGIRSRAARQLIAAGAVAVGATSVPGPGTYWQTWGMGAGGRTLNPYRGDRTPGGSSAGSAVAVAAGMVPLATGSDGAGSVRIPAAWCGIYGLRTTRGLLPSPDRTGLATAGVLARSAAEVEAYLRCVVPGYGHGTAGGADGSASDGALPVTGVWSADLGFAHADLDPDVVAVARRAAARFVSLEEEPDFALRDPKDAWFAVRGERETVATRALRRDNDVLLEQLFGRTRLLLTPTAPFPPHGHDGPDGRYSTALTWAFNVSGHPAISVPAGFTPDGCPVGLQIVSAFGTESLLARAAAAFGPCPQPPPRPR